MIGKIAALAGTALLVGGCSLLGTPSAEVGECLDIDINAAAIDSLDGFECSEEHDVEVYVKTDLSIDGDYDAAAVDSASIDACLDGFDDYVGIPYADSLLEVFYVYPDSAGWDGGDRETLCMVYPVDPETGGALRTTGSVKGTAA